MSSLRRKYRIPILRINGRLITEVIIDPHYEKRHGTYMNDEIILSLVRQLHRTFEEPEARSEGFTYFGKLIHESGIQYRIIWVLPSDENYIGIINAYRDERRK